MGWWLEPTVSSDGTTQFPGAVALPDYSAGLVAPNKSFRMGRDGDLIFRDAIGQDYFAGDKIWEFTAQKPSDDWATNVYNSTTETTVWDSATAGRNGLFPILKPNFFLNGFGGFAIHHRLGGNWNAGLTNIHFRVYGTVNGVDLLLGYKRFVYAQASSYLAGTNVPAACMMWFDPISRVSPGDHVRIRSHGWWKNSNSGQAGTGSDYENGQETYAGSSDNSAPFDGTKQCPLRCTIQMEQSSGTHQIFYDGCTIDRRQY